MGCSQRELLYAGGGTDSSGETDGSDTSSSMSGPSSGNPSGPSSGNPSDPTTNPTTGQPMDGPPRLIDADFLEGNVVQLTFSEPIATVDGVEPEKFRMSVGRAYRDYYYAGTQYVDLGYFSEYNCYEYCDPYCEYEPECCFEYCGPAYPFDPVLSVELWNDQNDNTRVNMRIEPGIRAESCDFIQQQMNGEGGIFVHYSNNGSPAIRDYDNEQLDAIAEHWVLTSSSWASQEEIFPQMDPYLPIPCIF